MKKIIRKFLLISIVLSTTQSLEISFLPLSLFQIFLILLFIFCFIDIIQKRKITRGDYIYFTIICLVSSILAYFTSLNTLWAKSYMLSGIMISGIIFSICKYFTNQDLPILQKSLIRSQYLTLFFSIYNMYFFYVKKEVVKYINIGFLSVVLDDAFIKRASVSGQLRLSLPYATPPILSIVMSMCICILLFNKNLYSKVLRIFLLIFFSIVLIFTMSRTGVISLIFALFIYFIKDLKKLIKISNIFIFLIFIFIFLLLFNKSIYLNKFINRFNINNIIQDRHFLVPVDGIIIWLSSLKNFVLGI